MQKTTDLVSMRNEERKSVKAWMCKQLRGRARVSLRDNEGAKEKCKIKISSGRNELCKDKAGPHFSGIKPQRVLL